MVSQIVLRIENNAYLRKTIQGPEDKLNLKIVIVCITCRMGLKKVNIIGDWY